MGWRSEITPLLFLGGSPPNADEPFDLVVNLEHDRCAYGSGRPDGPSLYVHAPCDDGDTIPPWTEELTDLVLRAVVKGRRTLVHCSAGWNRSGLVVGRVLVNLGYEPPIAVKHMRLARDPGVLCNKGFESYVLYGREFARRLGS